MISTSPRKLPTTAWMISKVCYEIKRTVRNHSPFLMPGAISPLSFIVQIVCRPRNQDALSIDKAAKYIHKNPKLATLKQSDFCS